MKLYCHPLTTTSRPLLLFIGETGAAIDVQVVDIRASEHLQPAFRVINPSQLLPVLDDDGFLLTESSAILKFLAERSASDLYPSNLRQRARVNERMDWIATQISRNLVFGFIYPQIFPTHKRRSREAQDATLEWARVRARKWLEIMDRDFLGPCAYLCGETISIADYYASSFIALAEVTGSTLADYPNLAAWLSRMKELRSWGATFAAIDAFRANIQSGTLMAV
jgi:glutathione S-transferase